MRWPDGLDRATVRAIVADVDVEVDAGCVVLDRDLNVTGAATLDVEGSSVSYDASVDVARSCTLVVAERLDWPQVRLRPWMSLASRRYGSFRMDLGTFRVGHPTQTAGQDWQVTGYDLTSALTFPHGSTVEALADETYVARAQQVAATAGHTLTPAGGGDSRTLPRSRAWTLDTPTYTVLAELLAEGGYSAPWADVDGTLRTEVDRGLSEAPVEWTYDADDQDSTTVADDQGLDEGLDDVPNRLVAVTDSPLAWAAIEGDGMVTLEDEADQVRVGEIRTAVERIDASDQDMLVTRARLRFAELRRPGWTVEMAAAPSPLHDRHDVVRVVRGELGLDRRGVVTAWRLPLSGDDLSATVGAIGG